MSKDTDNVILQIHCRLIDFDEAKKFKNHDCCKRNICQIYKPLLITDSEDTIYRVSVKNILLDHQGGCCYPGVGILLKTNTPGGLQKRPKAGNLRWFFVLTRICLVTRGDWKVLQINFTIHQAGPNGAIFHLKGLSGFHRSSPLSFIA